MTRRPAPKGSGRPPAPKAGRAPAPKAARTPADGARPGRDPARTPADGERLAGSGIIRASLAGTAVFLVTAGLAAAFTDSPAGEVGVVVALVLFALGAAAYLAGYARAVQRSRGETIEMSGLVFLTGCAPKPVRRLLWASTAAQVAIALTTAALRPFTTLAFGILAPLYGLGLQCLWASRHGVFAVRPPPVRRPPRGAPSRATGADDTAGGPTGEPIAAPPPDAPYRPGAPPPVPPPPGRRRSGRAPNAGAPQGRRSSPRRSRPQGGSRGGGTRGQP